MKINLKIVALICFYSLTNAIIAQEKSIGIDCGYGFTSPHHAYMWNYITGHAWQINSTFSTERFANIENKKSIFKAINITFINSGNPDEIGYSIGICPQFHFPIFNKKNTFFNLGCGIDYNSKKYTKENYNFTAIGSHFNALIQIGLMQKLMIAKNFKIKTGFFVSHFSNGATKMPNLGLNIITFNLGAEYFWHNNKSEIAKIENDISCGKWQFVATSSCKQKYIDSKITPVFAIMSEKYFRPLNNSGFGVRCDMILDLTMQEKFFVDDKPSLPFSDNFKVALKAAWATSIGHLQINLQAGSYLLNKNFKKEFAFERLAIRYFFTENIGLNIGLRAHFAKADAIEFGCVYKL